VFSHNLLLSLFLSLSLSLPLSRTNYSLVCNFCICRSRVILLFSWRAPKKAVPKERERGYASARSLGKTNVQHFKININIAIICEHLLILLQNTIIQGAQFFIIRLVKYESHACFKICVRKCLAEFGIKSLLRARVK
jgi:hypothetical protein